MDAGNKGRSEDQQSSGLEPRSAKPRPGFGAKIEFGGSGAGASASVSRCVGPTVGGSRPAAGSGRVGSGSWGGLGCRGGCGWRALPAGQRREFAQPDGWGKGRGHADTREEVLVGGLAVLLEQLGPGVGNQEMMKNKYPVVKQCEHNAQNMQNYARICKICLIIREIC
jgi:hypothetical protein